MEKTKLLRQTLQERKGQKQQVLSDIKSYKQIIKQTKKDIYKHEQAQQIIDEVGLKTQQELQYHISDITTMALQAVFEEQAYNLVVEFVKRRGKTECDLIFERDGNKADPLTASGGGTVDVASFALRVASWSMTNPKLRNTIVLDEPLRYLSQDKQEKASIMIKELSKKLNLQFIIITHESELTNYADKIFQTQIKNGKTVIK